MALSGVKKIPQQWAEALVRILAGNDLELVAAALATIRALRPPTKPPEEWRAALLNVASNATRDATVRLTALAALAAQPIALEQQFFDLVRSSLDREKPVAVRTLAAEVAARSSLSTEQLVALTRTLKAVGPMELDRVLEAFGSSSDDRVGRSLIAALRDAPARASLRPETLKPRLAKFGPAVLQQAEELFALLRSDTAKQQARLEQLLAAMPKGDIRRGQVIFNSAKAACHACHAVGYLGGNIGPDLTRIGSIRAERDLLEAIVFPSASLVRSYEPVLVATKDGKFHNGLVRKDAPDEMVLVTGVNQEVRIPRKDIDDVQPSRISIMPAGLDQQLSQQELADLVAFLRACK